MPKYTYLDLATARLVHARAMERSGHEPTSLLFPDRLLAALERPRFAAYYGNADFLTQVAILTIAISEAQAFENGNKRTAMAACLTFLELNGLEYTGDSELLAVVIAEAASPSSSNAAVRHIVDWLRTQIRPLGRSTT